MRLVRSARPAAGEDMQHMLLYCRGLLGLKRQAELRTSAAVPSPLVTGVLHPVILLPEEAVEPQDLKCLLLHELNHIRRRDLWVRLCSAAALIVHWYNPLFHMLDRTVREVGRSAATKTWPSCSTAGSGSGTDRCYCKWPPGTPDKRAPGPCVFLPGRPWKGGSAKCCTQRL
ncbi:MAG: M56 family metallopeptidase [Dysosmobacter sp.]